MTDMPSGPMPGGRRQMSTVPGTSKPQSGRLGDDGCAHSLPLVCLPYAEDAERTLFGGALQGWPDHLAALAELAEEDLGDPRLRRLLLVITGLVARGIRPSPSAALDDLCRAGDVTYRAGAAGPFLIDLADAAQWPMVGRHELVSVLRAGWRRRIVQAGMRLVQAGPDSSDQALVELVQREHDDMASVRQRLLRAEAGR